MQKTETKKICTECGQVIHEIVESILTECERCLSKKSE